MNLSHLKTSLDKMLTEARKVAFIAPKHNGMILLMRRSKDGSWGLPGGKKEKKETLETAAKRETAEETNMKFKKLKKVKKFTSKNKSIHIFTTKAIKQLHKFKMNEEHIEFGFFNINELNEFVKGNTSSISLREKDGTVKKVLTKQEFKLHKSTKLFISNKR